MMAMDFIVPIAVVFALVFLAAWISSPTLRAWIERPKYRFLAEVEGYDRVIKKGGPSSLYAWRSAPPRVVATMLTGHKTATAATPEYGKRLLAQTRQYLGSASRRSCASCHIDAGAEPGNSV